MASATERNRGDTGCDAVFSSEPDAGLKPPEGRRTLEDREARIRAVLGLRARGPLPAANEATLLRYYQHLAPRLAMPFKARHCPEAEPGERAVTVVALLDPREWDRGQHAGLLCAVRAGGEEAVAPLFEIEVAHDHANFQLLEDYWFWFWNWRNRALDRWAS